MKNLLLSNIIVYIIVSLLLLFSKGFYFGIFIKAIQLYILLFFSAIFSFLNFSNFTNTKSIIVAFTWVLLVFFTVYIKRYRNEKFFLYLLVLILLLWLALGLINPMFKA